MAAYTIEAFWRVLTRESQAVPTASLAGWEVVKSPLSTFVEAPLELSEDFGKPVDPFASRVILISAAGAVGKSTLAKQVSALTQAVYVDLAKTDPVGGNTLSGGLVKSGLLNAWQSDSVTLLIDGLDEARLKVTQESYEAFLNDVAYLVAGRRQPIVLFGRTGAVSDTWLHLEGQVDTSVLEIGYYPPDRALEFAIERYKEADPESQHFEAGKEALSVLLNRLRENTAADGDRFAGYAPVLQAIASRVAGEANPKVITSATEKGEQPITLQGVVDAILLREQGKLSTLAFEEPGLLDRLYLPAEQMDRLTAMIYGKPSPALPRMSPKDTQTYSDALQSWVPEHPFLDGNGKPATAVFDAALVTYSLFNAATKGDAVARELARGAAANPFLAEFYIKEDGVAATLLPDHIGIVYASLRARLSLGDTASLSVDGVDEGDEVDQLRADVEITLSRSGLDQTRSLHFASDQTGVIRLGGHVEDVEINAPAADVEIGGGREVVLVAPVSVQCQRLRILAEKLIVEAASEVVGSVLLEAESCSAPAVTSVPIINGPAKLFLSWPGADAYPWANFKASSTEVKDPRTDEALRRFRKFVISFRSHSKGSLKRVAAKLDHERMTKGTGRAVLDHMIDRGVITRDGAMYTLHPDALAAETGASYTSAMNRVFAQETVDFVNAAIT